MENKKRSWFDRGNDRPDATIEDTTPNLKFFFKQLFRKFGKLITLNLLMLFQVLPAVVIAFIYIYSPKLTMIESGLFAPLLGAQTATSSPLAALLLGAVGYQSGVPTLTTGRLVVILVLLGITALTWGWQNVGAAYNLRSLVRGDSFFLVSDYFYAIGRNLKQGFFFGLLDLLIMGVLGFDFFYFSSYPEQAFAGVMYVVIIALGILYLVMRFYIYTMMITFDLSVFKLLKNALIFTVLGIKRNLMALLGIALLVVLNFVAIMLGLSVGFSAPLVFPLFYLPALLGFIATYAAYPCIKRYMIDPYESENTSDPQETDSTTPQAADSP